MAGRGDRVKGKGSRRRAPKHTQRQNGGRRREANDDSAEEVPIGGPMSYRHVEGMRSKAMLSGYPKSATPPLLRLEERGEGCS